MNPNLIPESLRDVKDASVEKLQSFVFNQANLLFPDRTPNKAFMKLYEEMGEVIKDPTDPLEWADVFILMLDLSHMFKVDIAQAVLEKVRILHTREWYETPTGTMQHVPTNENKHK
jgi:hypothetical protein